MAQLSNSRWPSYLTLKWGQTWPSYQPHSTYLYIHTSYLSLFFYIPMSPSPSVSPSLALSLHCWSCWCLCLSLSLSVWLFLSLVGISAPKKIFSLPPVPNSPQTPSQAPGPPPLLRDPPCLGFSIKNRPPPVHAWNGYHLSFWRFSPCCTVFFASKIGHFPLKT